MRVELELTEDQVEELAQRTAEIVDEGLAPRPEPWLNVEQAAEYLACPKSRIYDLKSRGDLRCRMDGRRPLFRREWLDQVLTEPTI